jgi:hypothetical protein
VSEVGPKTVEQIDLALVARSLERRNYDPPIVVADLDAEHRFALARLFEDKRVALLRISQTMVINAVEVVFVACRHRTRRREPRVVEPSTVFLPCDRDEFRPPKVVGTIGAAGDVADEDILSIAAARRERVRDHRAGLVDLHGGQRDGTGGESIHRHDQVRIDQHARDSVESILHVEHRLILEAGIVHEEIPAPAFDRHAGTRVVVQRRQARDQPIPDGSVEQRTRQRILSVHPRGGLRAVRILEPAVWILHADAVVDVDDVCLRRGGISNH